jgi:hypothetical protein
VRVETPFPVTVRGVDRAGNPFRLDIELDNLSSTGLYMRLARPLDPGAALFVVIRLSTTLVHQVAAPGVAACGVVLRVEPQPDGRYGIAAAFRRHWFLYASTTHFRTHIS